MNCTSLPSVSWVIVMLESQDLGCCFPIGDNQLSGAAAPVLALLGAAQHWSPLCPPLCSYTAALSLPGVLIAAVNYFWAEIKEQLICRFGQEWRCRNYHPQQVF